jgi:phosphoribosylglycinamide formyltransferase 1
MKREKNIAIFASGNGTNAEEIINYFKSAEGIRVNLVLTNNSNAYVVERARNHQIPIHIFNRKEFSQEDSLLPVLKKFEISHIVLAGFLWLVPSKIIEEFEGRIVNIHPALLPKFGGKGMYGANVHKAVIAAGEQESGISIHYVNLEYDEGNIIFQAKCDVSINDSPESLALKIHQLEHKYYPKVIEEVINAD